jgi:hypothetical protein
MIFELSVLVLVAVFLAIFYKFDRNVLKTYAITFAAVLLFEYFTQSLWMNKGLEPWAYLYLDVSWVITAGWSMIIVVIRELAALYIPKKDTARRIFFDLAAITLVGFLAEYVVIGLNIRQYSPSVIALLSGIKIGMVPIEALYYIPVFMMLVLSFSLYWERLIFPKAKGAK